MMHIDFYCPRWGAENIPWRQFAHRIKSDGFVGVEVYPLDDMSKNSDMLGSIQDQGLSYILLHNEPLEGRNFGRYVDALERNLYTLLSYQTSSTRPRFIVSQTGREYYSNEQMEVCFDLCDRIAGESGIPIIQETHRNKWSFAAHIVKDYLLAYPTLKLALDLSHWVCVSESYLEDQQEAVDLAIKHTRHLHARVGHPQGPQVSDPRAPENRDALQYHLTWWDCWVDFMRNSGIDQITITPEFGPYPYMQHLPFTKKMVADQYQINCWMRELLAHRYC